MAGKHYRKKTHRRKHTRRNKTRKNGGGHGGLGGGPAYTSGASQVLKQMSPAPFSGGARRLKNTLKSIKSIFSF